MVVIIFGRAAQFILALVMMRVATTLLSPAEMGRVSLVLTTTACFALFLVNPVGMFINRRLHTWQSNGRVRQYLTHYVRYLFWVMLIAAISLFVFQRVLDFGLSMAWLILLVCGSLLFNTINQTAIPSLNLLGYPRPFVFLTLATLAVGFVCAILLVYFGQFSAQYWLLGLLIGQTVLGVVGVKVLFSHLSLPCDPAPLALGKLPLRTLFNFAWPVAFAAGLGWVQGQGYRYLLEGQLGLAQLGLFVAGYGISAGMIAGFESVLTTYFQPRLYRAVSQAQPAQQTQAWQCYARAVIPSLLLTMALIVLLAPELTQVFLGENFQSAADYVLWGALAETARVLMGVYSLIAHVYMKTRWLVLPNLVGAVSSILLCLLLIPKFGGAGAGIGLVLSGFSVVAILHFSLTRHTQGSILVRPVWMAVLAAALLWVITSVGHALMPDHHWGGLVTMLLLVGISYVMLQYWLLRQHLTGNNPE